ncbi:MAG: hypothetical protein Q7R91_02080 [bacterium]|nr:hypothetical protein [bacterium]
MVTLEELRRKLYGPKEPENKGGPRDIAREYGKGTDEEPKKFWNTTEIKILKKTIKEHKTSRLLANIIIFSLVLLFGLGVYIAYEIFFVQEEVNLTIAGPDGVETGERTDFVALIKNTGKIALYDVELNITYPEHTIAVANTGEAKGVAREKITFDKVLPGEEVKYDISVKFFGKIGDEETLTVLIIYRPENIQSRLIKKTDFTTHIARSPFVITLSSPEEISQNQRIELSFQINSEAKVIMANTSFRADYPSGFDFESAEPSPGFENNIWFLGDFAAGDSKKITIRGTIHGQPEEVKSFNGVFGQYNQATKEWLVFLEEAKGPKIASPFLFVRQDINGKREGTVNGGEGVRFTIFYKNNLSKKINDIVISEKVSEDVLNLNTLRVDSGAYDPVAHEIRWTGATLSELKDVGPGVSGTVSFYANLRPSPPLKSFSDKNFVLAAKAVIDTKNIPEEFSGVKLRYEDNLEFKINTKLTLNTRVVYFDSPVKNTGPLPPKVRKETTYTIIWQLANQSNDATAVEVKGGLPANVKWLGTVGDVPGVAMFNSASNEIVWNIPRVSAGTGILKPQATLIFRVALVPGEDQTGTSPVLVSRIIADGADSFTGEKLHDEKEDIVTVLDTDTTRDFDQWRVVP